MHPRSLVLTGGFILAPLTLHAADIFKANNSFTYNDPESWVPETLGEDPVVPGSGDIAVFDSSLLVGPKPGIGGSLSWGGIRADPSLGVLVTFGNTVGAVLSIGSGGIVNQSTGAGVLVIGSNLAATANQTWNAAAGTAKDSIAFSIPATMNLGGHTINRTGDGRINIGVGTGSTSLSNGSLVLGAGTTEFRSSSGVSEVQSNFTVRVDSSATWITSRGSAIGNSFNWNGNIQLNGGTWQVSGAANAVVIGGTINVMADSTMLYSMGTGSTAVDHEISAPVTGGGALAVRNTSANPNHRITLKGDNSGYSGQITLDGASGSRTVRLAGASAGSAAATWNVASGNILEIDGVSAAFGALEGNGIVRSTTVAGASLTVTSGTFDGIFDDGGSALAVTKTGTGTLRLNGINTHTGLTDVQGGTLAGIGSLAGSLRVHEDATLSPGNSTGTFSLGGSLTLDPGAIYLAQIAGTSSMDVVSLFGAAGTLSFDGTLSVALLNGFIPAAGNQFDLMDWNAGYTVSGSPTFELPALSDGLAWDTSSFLSNGTLSVIPEPSSLMLLALSGLCLARRSRRGAWSAGKTHTSGVLLPATGGGVTFF